METKANFVLIGAVTVLGVIGLLGLLAWFAKIEVDRQYDQYDVLFDGVAGLGMAADVRYNGLSVGKVIAIGFDKTDPGKVRVRIEVNADTPVKTDTTAQLNSQGVTGVAFVALSGGTPDAAFLRDTVTPPEIPLIPSELSVVQALTEEAPNLLAEAMEVIREVRSFLGPENQSAVSNLLQNLDNASGQLDQALSDFSDISLAVADGADEISKFTGKLEEIGVTVQEILVKVGNTLDAAEVAIGSIEPTMRSAAEAFDTAEATIGNVDTLVTTRVPDIADDMSATLRSMETATNDLRTQVDTVLSQFGGTADVATKRLAELEAPIARLETTLADAQTSMAAVESASVSFETLVDGDGAAVVRDARVTLKTVQESLAGMEQTLKEDIPTIVTDIRTAVTSATGVIDQVSTDVAAFATRLDPLADSGNAALKAATETLANANRTMANLDKALSTAEETLGAVERTFVEAETVMNADLGPAISDVRSAAGQFAATTETLSQDIPGLTADLREVMARALSVIQDVDATVSAAAPSLRDFSRTGLPEFTKFAREAQQLVYQLEQLAKKIERDPARFFFGNNVPEFRR
jgi:phospholipid/cholesterol/gamma-HCH transport system substrate-binding protein